MALQNGRRDAYCLVVASRPNLAGSRELDRRLVVPAVLGVAESCCQKKSSETIACTLSSGLALSDAI
jgi:hypothetical protein